MDDFRGNAVVTFDIEAKGALVLERADELHHSISRWLEKNAEALKPTPWSAPVEAVLAWGEHLLVRENKLHNTSDA
jgi:hypothetical protein